MLLPAWMGDHGNGSDSIGAGCSQLPLVWLQVRARVRL
jgi:hypothetical protein